MAGREVEIPSKSYHVRWVKVDAGHSISWSIRPHKHSLNFGIFKHPGSSTSSNLAVSANVEQPSTPSLSEGPPKSKGGSGHDQTKVVEKLSGMGYKSVAWTGTCEADKDTEGTYDVPEGEDGMYGLVLDNTFSKQNSKKATLMLMTHPTNAAPASDLLGSSSFHTGILQKKKRKRNQGYARRFFSLDFTSSTLSYYRNQNSSALRGSIPLNLAEIGVDENRREISVDSGAEIWRLKALNKKDYEGWRNALIKSANSAKLGASQATAPSELSFQTARLPDPSSERDWNTVENLVGHVAGIRDAVRRLAQDTDPKYQPAPSSANVATNGSASASPVEATEATDYFGSEPAEKADKLEKPSFWKRKPSSSGQSHSPSSLLRKSVSAQLAVPSPLMVPSSPNGSIHQPKRGDRPSLPAHQDVHSHCMAILRDLDSVVSQFSALVGEQRRARTPIPSRMASRSRASIDSASSEEFFDAPETEPGRQSGFLTIRRDSDEGDANSMAPSDTGSASSSEEEGIGSFDRTPREGQPSMFPTKPKSLPPLPLEGIKRRTTVPPPKSAPPSLIGFLRKNVGKDLSTIAMPVSANEPTSLLQKVAEQMEYSELLDAAIKAPEETGERILHIAAFALSNFSNSRLKERAIRKPFNPMLGETFELIREDKGYRFMSEKVTHRPVQLACQAEHADWAFMQSPIPVQKFWGKSAELNTEGRAHVILHPTGEHYSWTIATSFLRNIIAGEKYVEPTGTMTVINETNGSKAVATFKAGGMFAGRSEDVTVQATDAHGAALPMGLTGKWTSHLNLTKDKSDTGDAIWQVGSLVDNASHKYGFTSFAAALNEITSVEKGHLPITDSRLRPDQRAAEDGHLDEAEALKARLEERQRSRRRVMEEHGNTWTPRWFSKVSGEGEKEELWRLKTGKDGYWEERERGEWTKVVDVFEK